MCRMSWNPGTWTSWNPQGLYRPVMGLLYLFNTSLIPVHYLYINTLFVDSVVILKIHVFSELYWKACIRSGERVLLIVKLICRWWWVFNATLWLFYPRERAPVPIVKRLVGAHGRSRCEWTKYSLTLYAPCIILQYVYKPTSCTKFLWLDFIFNTRSTCFGLY